MCLLSIDILQLVGIERVIENLPRDAAEIVSSKSHSLQEEAPIDDFLNAATTETVPPPIWMLGVSAYDILDWHDPC